MTNITNEQLDAWAGLGPWSISPLVTPPLIYSDKRHGGTGLWIASIYADAPGEREHHQTNAALIAASPALAAALLAERKAREMEVGELREALAHEGIELTIAARKRIQALKGQRDE